MPIKIPDKLPARKVLNSENIFVMTEKKYPRIHRLAFMADGVNSISRYILVEIFKAFAEA